MFFKKLVKVAAAAVVFAVSTGSIASVIDFENFTNGEIVNGTYNIDEVYVTISAENTGKSFDYAVAFDTTLSSTRDPDLEGDFFSFSEEISNPGNILIVQENSRGCNDGVCNKPDDEGTNWVSFIFEFSESVSISSIDFFDINDYESGTVTYSLEDGSSEVAGIPFSGGDISDGGENTWATLYSSITGVTSLVIDLNGSGAIDNITFDLTSVGSSSNLTSVPEPTTVALFGLSYLGLCMSRKKKKLLNENGIS